MLPCFGFWNHKGEIACLKGLQEYGKSGEKSFIRENIFCNFDTSYTLMTWIIYSLNWCKWLQDICRYTKSSSRNGTIITVMNVNLNAVLQTWQCFLFDSYFCPRFNLFWLFFLLMVVVRCVLARLGIVLVSKSGSVFAECVCFLISSRYKKFALHNFWTKLKAILWSLQTKKLFWNSLAHLPPMQNT